VLQFNGGAGVMGCMYHLVQLDISAPFLEIKKQDMHHAGLARYRQGVVGG
jgi:hypothetical protein